MEKNIKASSRRIRSSFLLVFITAILFVQSQAFAYKDQVVIEMPNSAKTTYDIRVHAFIRNLYERGSIINPNTNEWLVSFFEDERHNYIEQYLAQTYVNDNGLNLKPDLNEVKAGVQKVERVFSKLAEKEKVYKLLDVTDPDVAQWVLNRLILNNFLTKTIRDRVVITDQKLQEHYQTWKSTRFLNKNYEEVADRVKEDLFNTLQTEEFQKWIDQEIRRQKMILKVVSIT